MKSIIIVFAALLMIIATPAFFQHVDDVLTEELTQNFSGVETPSLTAANVTLNKSLYGDDISAVQSITSNISSDYPSAYSYNTLTYALEIYGLSENGTRALSVEVLIDNTDLEDGMAIFWTVIRWLWVFIILGMVGAAIYAFFD
jgi:hypothetical protein